MFILTKIADLVQIEPEDLNNDSMMTIVDNINAKYANKVIQKIGLCICLYDLLSASQGQVGHGTGLVNVNVEFRLVVFRPFKDEVLLGRISAASTSGIIIRTQFFDDIFVPADKLPEGSYYSHEEQLYVWMTEGQPLYYDHQETVRFRVVDEVWQDLSPTGPATTEEDDTKRQAPYTLIASMQDAGLGPCLWWDGEDEAEEEAE